MATTTNYNFNKPTIGGSQNTWGADLNENWDSVDAILSNVTSDIQTQIDGLDEKAPISNPTFSGTATIPTVQIGSWTVYEDGSSLYFKYGSTIRMKLDSSGNLTVEGNVTAYGSL